MVAIGYVSPIPNDPTKVLKAGDTMTGDLILSGAGTDLTVGGATTINYGGITVNAGEGLSTALSTGVISGGMLSINANPAMLDIGAVVAYIIDYTSNPLVPTLTKVTQPAKTVAMDAGSLARVVTWWVMDSAGAIIQLGVPPTNEQRRTMIPLGLSAQTGGAIFTTETLSVQLNQPMNQLYDLFHALGAFSVMGNFISPNGANLSFNKSAGTIFSPSFGRSPTPNNPHVSVSPAQTPVTFRRITQGSGGGLPVAVTTVDPTMYDVGGVLTPVPGANDATIQRVWLIASDVTALQVVVQYGQAFYPTITNALDRIGSEPYVIDPVIFEAAALIGYIIVQKNCTALNNSAQAVLIQASNFSRS